MDRHIQTFVQTFERNFRVLTIDREGGVHIYVFFSSNIYKNHTGIGYGVRDDAQVRLSA